MERSCLRLIVALLAAPAVAFAQDAPPVFRSGIDVITIPVRVLDSDGRPVEGLTASDFTVLVDNQSRTVVSVDRVRPGPAAQQPAETLRQPFTFSTNTNAIASGPTRTVWFVVDAGGFDASSARTVVTQLQRLVDEAASGDLLGLTTLPSLSPTVDPTADREQLKAALRGLMGAALPSSLRFQISPGEAFAIERGDRQVREEVVGRECWTWRAPLDGPGGVAPCPRLVLEDARLASRALRESARRRLRAFVDLIGALPATSDPKHVVLITPGLPRVLVDDALSRCRCRPGGEDGHVVDSPDRREHRRC